MSMDISLGEAARRAEINRQLAEHPIIREHTERTRAASLQRVEDARLALVRVQSHAERSALEEELRNAKIAHGRLIGIPDPEDPQMRFAGPALLIVGGSDPTQAEWFQRQCEEQARNIPKTPTFQQQLESGDFQASLPPAGSIFIGDQRADWVHNWGRQDG